MGRLPPLRPLPDPLVTTGTLRSEAKRTSRETSSVVFGKNDQLRLAVMGGGAIETVGNEVFLLVKEFQMRKFALQAFPQVGVHGALTLTGIRR